jgi:ribonuclease P/MRP protein subunit RPP40
MVAGLKGKTYQDKLREVGLTSLEDRRDRGDMIKTFRIIHGLDSVETGTRFQMAGDRAWEGAVNTRQSRDITSLVEGESHY